MAAPKPEELLPAVEDTDVNVKSAAPGAPETEANGPDTDPATAAANVGKA